MSERTKKIIRICAGLLFLLPYSLSVDDGLITVKALLWEVEIGKKGGIPHLRIRCPHIISALLK